MRKMRFDVRKMKLLWLRDEVQVEIVKSISCGRWE